MSRRVKVPGASRQADGSWRVRVVVKNDDGRRLERVVRAPAGTSVAALLTLREEVAEELRRSVPSGALNRVAGGLSVGDYARAWHRARSPLLRTSTRVLRTQALHKFMPAAWDELDARSVRRVHCQALLAHLIEMRTDKGKPYAAATLSHAWSVLTQILRDLALDYELPDPTRRVRFRLPDLRPPRRERATLTTAEVAQLLEFIWENSPSWHAEVAFAAATGVRAGELYELRWSDIDWENHMAHVQRAHWRGVVGPPKNGRARWVAWPAWLAPYLRAKQRAEGGGEEDLCFPAGERTQSPTNHRHPGGLWQFLRSVSARAALPFVVTPHILRRTANSRLLELGVDPITIRAQLGHVSDRMTERYADVHRSTRRRAMELLGQSIRPAHSGPDVAPQPASEGAVVGRQVGRQVGEAARCRRQRPVYCTAVGAQPPRTTELRAARVGRGAGARRADAITGSLCSCSPCTHELSGTCEQPSGRNGACMGVAGVTPGVTTEGGHEGI